MARQNLPIYARTRTIAGPARLSDHGTRQGHGALVAVSAGALLPLRHGPQAPAPPTAYRVSTLAGKVDTVFHASNQGPHKPLPIPVWRSGFRDGSGRSALFNKPTGLAVDRRGNVYVADSLNHCVRRISPRGRVSTLAGNGERGHADGSGRRVRFSHPTGLALAPGNVLYVVDQGNGLLRCLAPGGKVSSLPLAGKPLGGIAVDAQGLIHLLLELGPPARALVGLAQLDPHTGETRLLADWEGRLQWLPYRAGEEDQPFSRWSQQRSHRPRLVEASAPGLGEGLGLAFDAQGTLCWLAGSHLYRLEQGAQLQLQRQALRLQSWPGARWQGLSVDADGVIHVLDARHHTLYRIAPGRDPEPVLQAGLEGLQNPYSVVTDGYGQIYISDTGHWRVCRLVPPGRDAFLRLARLAFLPYARDRAPQADDSPIDDFSDDAGLQTSRLLKGLSDLVDRQLRRKAPTPESLPPAVAEQYVLDVLEQGNRSQQLACVKELVDQLRVPPGRTPGAQLQALIALQPIFAALLGHRDTSVRTLLVRHICDLVHSEKDALFFIGLLDGHQESNRLLKKYLIEVLAFLGKRYELYGHVVPLMVEYIRSAEEDVVEHVFQHLLAIRRAGYESLIDPLIEDMSG